MVRRSDKAHGHRSKLTFLQSYIFALLVKRGESEDADGLKSFLFGNLAVNNSSQIMISPLTQTWVHVAPEEKIDGNDNSIWIQEHGDQ